jgi:hypothetical protein
LETRKRTPHVAVVGAGIAGIGVAIELAMRGCTVDLYEKTDRVHGQASLANEGKIHLGYIYANDPTQRTARQMVEGAWSFSPILREWLEGAIADTSRSTGFDYLVHHDSLRSPDELAITYAQIAELNREVAQRSDASYFGLAAERPPRRLSRQRLEAEYGPDVLAAFETPEIAVDTEVIGAALARRISADPRIRLHLGAEVLSASRRDGVLTLEVRQDDVTERPRFDHVVNASWEDLLRIDASVGLAAPPGSSFRWRWVVRVRAPHGAQGVGSVSVVLGGFGDVVEYGAGDIFFSWYPFGRRDMVTDLRPPASWSRGADTLDAVDVKIRSFDALRALVPALDHVSEASLAAATVLTGVVYARGTTDIQDPGSGLHERHAIGARSVGTYHSLDTGKYTTAPLFARRLAQRIGGEL